MRKEKRQRGESVPSNYEIDIMRKDGEIRRLGVFRKDVLWNGKTQFRCSITTLLITNGRRSPEVIGTELPQLVRQFIDGIRIIDADWHTLYVNGYF